MTSWYYKFGMLLFEHSPNGRSLLAPSVEQLNSIYSDLLAKANEKLEEGLSISPQEAFTMRKYYQSKVRDICQALEFSMAVSADAHFLLHKYFTRFSALEHELKHVMLACIFLATKCQNMHLTMDEFVKNIPNTQAELIVDLELVVLECIDFRPPTFSPLPCLFGFLMDYLPVVEGQVNDIHERAQQALEHLQIALMIEEIALINSPSAIALACVLENIEESETYWETRLGKLQNVTELFKDIEEIKRLISTFEEVNTDEVKSIDKKIKIARQSISQ